MKNAVIYILLCIISTVLFVYSLLKKKDNKLIVLYFFIAGMTYFLEYMVVVLFDGYVYYPRILKNQYYDNILGAVVSDAFTIPMVAVLVAAFSLNLKKIFFIATVITIIEVIFIKTKLYEHHWWRYYYTFGGAVIVYHYSKNLLALMRKRISKVIRYISLFFSNLLIHSSAVFILAAILNLYFYNIHWFENPYRSHVAFASAYIIIISAIFAFLVAFKLKWVWVCSGLLLLSIADIILLKVNILTMSESWSLGNFIIVRILILSCVYLINRYLLTEADETKM